MINYTQSANAQLKGGCDRPCLESSHEYEYVPFPWHKYSFPPFFVFCFEEVKLGISLHMQEQHDAYSKVYKTAMPMHRRNNISEKDSNTMHMCSVWVNRLLKNWFNFYSTKPWKFFPDGNCRYGRRCRFCHESNCTHVATVGNSLIATMLFWNIISINPIRFKSSLKIFWSRELENWY